MKVRFGQDACYFFPFIALNLDLAVFHCATRATSALHLFSQLFFFGQPYANKVLDQRNSLAAAPCLDP